MKWILLSLITLSCGIYLSYQTIAKAEVCSLCGEAPLTCPPRQMLIAQGLDPFLVVDLSGNYYAGFQGQSAGTMSLWTLRIGPIVAPSPTIAFQIANATLPLAQLFNGPIHMSQSWVCNYISLNGILVQTITPPIGCFNASAP